MVSDLPTAETFWASQTKQITIVWKKKKGTLHVVKNNMIIQGAEIPRLPLAQQTLS